MPHVEEQIIHYAHTHGVIAPGLRQTHSLIPDDSTGLTANQLADIRKASPSHDEPYRVFCPAFANQVGVSILFDDGDPALEITNNSDSIVDVTGGFVKIIIQRVCNI